MKAVLQRVSKATVKTQSGFERAIDRGLVVLLGIEDSDGTKECEFMLDRIVNLRIFEDEKGKTNLSLSDINGDLLLISQFTLLADTSRGRRPSFHTAGDPVKSRELFGLFVKSAKERVKRTESGLFGEKMTVELTNEGPFTVILDSVR